MNKWKKHEGYLFISPWLIGVVLFVIFPIIYSFYLSFTKWSLAGSPSWIGLENYKNIMIDPKFRKSLSVTIKYVLMTVPPGIFFSILIAVLLNQNIAFRSVFRTIFYLPAVLSGIAVYILWAWIFNPDFGLLNSMLKLIGIQGPKWLQSTKWALPSLAIVSLWGVGGNMVIYLAGLQGIPRSYYEAAYIDGATNIQSFFKITLPLLTPTIFFNLIMSIINSFQVFTQAMVMTGGGPGDATLFYVLYLYNNAFRFFRMGYASALAWILMVIVVILNVIIFRTSDRWVHYESGDK